MTVCVYISGIQRIACASVPNIIYGEGEGV